MYRQVEFVEFYAVYRKTKETKSLYIYRGIVFNAAKDKSWLCSDYKLRLYPLLYPYKTIKTPKKNQDIKVIKSFTVPHTDQYYGVLFGNKLCNVFENDRFVCSQKHWNQWDGKECAMINIYHINNNM